MTISVSAIRERLVSWSAFFEIAYRLLRRGRRFGLDFTGWISLAGLVLGVACLTVSMAVMSGFERTLRESLSDVTGHIQIFRYRVQGEDGLKFLERVKGLEPNIVGATRFLSAEGVLAHSGRIQGVFMQGLDEDQAWSVLNLHSRLQSGSLEMSSKVSAESPHPRVLIGKGVAAIFSLKPGDIFRLLVPLPNEFDPQEFKRKVEIFQVAGIVEMGKFEYDQRMIIMPIRSLQRLVDVGDRDSGLILRLKNGLEARRVNFNLSEALGAGYRVRDWRDINENIFEAVEIERLAVFFVILVIVIAASFNVATSLYVNVVQRYPDIGILKALGVSPRRMVLLLCLQGFALGVMGCFGGLGLGVILGALFEWGQTHLGLIPASVYKITHVELDYRWLDVLSIVTVTLIISTLATLAPARQGAKLSPVEGLRYE